MFTMFLLVPSLLVVLVLIPFLLFCLRIKSSKKDPAFIGTEGTIHAITKDEPDATGLSSQDTPKSSPFILSRGTPEQHSHHNVSNTTSNRTPSRSGERKLPDIPKEDQEESNSDLYATLDASDSDDEDTVVVKQRNGNILLGMQHHPYAKVRKSKVEHPYATVKKNGSQNGTDSALASSSNGAVNNPYSKVNSHTSSSSSLSDNEQAVLLCPGRGSRAGSGRSGSHPHLEASSSHHSVNSRQAAPLPPEPQALLPNPGMIIQNPSQQQFFSGDSQDSSKGYTSISVREPVRHIHLQRPNTVQDATYATVSETSDDMYAAIEDPTYIPTGGQSQSNSDTYAVIDLPDEDRQMTSGEAASAPSEPAAQAVVPKTKVFHPYSKIDKRTKKQREGPQLPPPQRGPVANQPFQRHSQDLEKFVSQSRNNLEELYAKVHKRSSLGNTLSDDVENDEIPVGASAMHSSLDMSQMQWADNNTFHHSSLQPRGSNNPLSYHSRPGTDRRSEISYADYEVTLYDKNKISSSKRDSDEGGYETLNQEGGYELLPEEMSRRKRLNSSNGGYETVPGAVTGQEEFGGYEQVPDYWRSNNSGGYETVKEPISSNRDPGYEVVRTSSPDPYSSISRPQQRKDHPGYESLKHSPKKSEPPYAKLRNLAQEEDVSDNEMGYETIPRLQAADAKSETNKNAYDPGYEILANKPNETPATNTADIGASSFAFQQPLIPVEGDTRRPSLIKVEGMEVSDVDNDSNSDHNDVNSHIFV